MINNKLYFFNDFVKNVLNENCEARESAIEICLSHVKEEFGDPTKDVHEFLKRLKEKGGSTALENFINQEVEPKIDKIVAQETLTNGGFDFDEVLRGLIAYHILQLQIKKKKIDVDKKMKTLHKE